MNMIMNAQFIIQVITFILDTKKFKIMELFLNNEKIISIY